MAKVGALEGAAAKAMQLLILTAARTGEVIGAKWSEIDLQARVWTVPGERMKARKDHRVPLTTKALSLLGTPPDDRNRPLFASGDPDTHLSNMAMAAVLKRMNRSDITVHGFRSTFRDWVAEKTDYPRDLAEMALAHTIESKVEAAYRRGDMFEKRRRLMEDWAQWASPR